MTNLEEFNLINELYEIYGKLLTKKQVLIMDAYYKYNLSLSEISENYKISRSAVLDSLKHSKEKLFEFENKIGMHKKSLKIIKIIDKTKLSTLEKKKIIKEL